MGHALLRCGCPNFPLIVSGRERGLRFYPGKMKGGGARPDIVKHACAANQVAVVIEDAQRPAGQRATGRAFDADLEPETLARRYGGRQTPDVHTRSVSLRYEGERGRVLLVRNPVLLL